MRSTSSPLCRQQKYPYTSSPTGPLKISCSPSSAATEQSRARTTSTAGPTMAARWALSALQSKLCLQFAYGCVEVTMAAAASSKLGSVEPRRVPSVAKTWTKLFAEHAVRKPSVKEAARSWESGEKRSAKTLKPCPKSSSARTLQQARCVGRHRGDPQQTSLMPAQHAPALWHRPKKQA